MAMRPEDAIRAAYADVLLENARGDALDLVRTLDAGYRLRRAPASLVDAVPPRRARPVAPHARRRRWPRWGRSAGLALGTLGAVAGIMAGWTAVPAQASVRDLHRSVIQFADLPPAPAQPFAIARFDHTRYYRHFTATMLSGGGYFCFPLRALSHLPWRQGVAQAITRAAGTHFQMCGYRFSNASGARKAYAAVHAELERDIKVPDSYSLLRLPKLGDQRIGATYYGSSQIAFRRDNALVQVWEYGGVDDHARWLLHIATLINRRLQ